VALFWKGRLATGVAGVSFRALDEGWCMVEA